MKTAAILSFTDAGEALAEKVAAAVAAVYVSETLRPRGGLMPAAAELFRSRDALIFIGACGIAVRAIAPHVAKKTADPAVVVLDEKGRFAISLLSGHMGGANDLARLIAERLGAEAVITTATDVNRRFSVDSWAKKQGLVIGSMEAAKRFSAAILRDDLPLCSDLPIDGDPPSGVYFGSEGPLGACVSFREKAPFGVTLPLIPRVLHLGIGCKRGTEEAAIRDAAARVLAEHRLRPEAVRAIASVDVKRDEGGLLAFAASLQLTPAFYTAEELASVEGDFTPSDFVKRTVGVDNVCERAAMQSAGAGGSLIVRKTGGGGVTVAVAAEDRRFRFE